MNCDEQIMKLVKDSNAFEARVKYLESAEYKRSIAIAAIRDLASAECPVSGYIIINDESRKQINDWADFQEKHGDF